MPTETAATVKVLYDGECPFCRREIEWLQRRDRKGRLAAEDIAALGFDPGRYGLTAADVAARLHAVLPDGRVLRGMAAVRAIYRAVGLGWVAAPTGWPLLRPAFDALYTVFAKNRIRLGGLFGRRCDADHCAR